MSNYTNSILANMEALDDGYDEALLLDASGFVSEGAGENIFVVKGGVVYTPDLSALCVRQMPWTSARGFTRIRRLVNPSAWRRRLRMAVARMYCRRASEADKPLKLLQFQ